MATFEQRLTTWFFEGEAEPMPGPHVKAHHTTHWWRVMCLTGVDYFSTLAYQPSIAFLAAGALAPMATLVLIILTLFGALPMYGRIADMSPNGRAASSSSNACSRGGRGKWSSSASSVSRPRIS